MGSNNDHFKDYSEYNQHLSSLLYSSSIEHKFRLNSWNEKKKVWSDESLFTGLYIMDRFVLGEKRHVMLSVSWQILNMVLAIYCETSDAVIALHDCIPAEGY